jgi:hypothetical protein
MLAFALGDAKFASERSTVIASLGVAGPITMLTKVSAAGGCCGCQRLQPPLRFPMRQLHLLFYNQYEHGARFLGEADRLIRAVTARVRSEVDRAAALTARAQHASASEQRRKVEEVLTESVYM